MMSIRSAGLLCALLLVGACDKDPTPPQTPPSPATPAVSEAPAPAPVEEPKAKPAAKPAPVQTVKPLQPLIESTLEPLPEKPPKVAAPEPVKFAPPSPQPPDKIQRLQVKAPQTAAQKKASDAVKQAKVEKPKLDLHLPKDLVKKLEPEVAITPGGSPAPSKTTEPALLPQMFAEKPNEQSAFEMGGRVITTDKNRDPARDSTGLLDSVDGAELQFKFRH